MGLFGDIAGKVVLKYEADTAQAKIALRELTGEQKANAKAAIQGMEDQKAAHDRMVKGITVGLGIAAGAVAIGIGSFKAYEEQTRLTAASSGADIGALRKASHGLLTDLELMQVAASGMNGRFKLSSAEMGKVLEASVALERKGLGPLSEITEKLGEAVKKGEIDPLKELGIAYDETLAKTDKRAAALKALTDLSNQASSGTNSETEAIRQHGVAFRNSMNQIEASIGQLVVSMEPLIGVISKIVSTLDSDWRVDIGAGKALTGTNLVSAGIFTGTKATTARADAARAQSRQDVVDAARRAREARTKGRGGGSGGGYELNAADGGGMVNFRTSAAEQIDRIVEAMERARLAELKFTADAIGDTSASDALAGGAGGKRGPTRDAAGLALGKGGSAYGADKVKQPTLLEKMFGTPDDIAVYDGLMAGLMSSVTAGYEALVTGSESFGKAAKRVIGQTIMAEGSHMLVLALREGAQAIAALATGNFAAAGTHGLAAAKFGAGAALAGVVASQLGAGGTSTGSAGASAGGGAGGSSTVADNAPRNTNIVLGHGWDDETNRQRAARFARAQRQASSYEGAPAGVVYS